MRLHELRGTALPSEDIEILRLGGEAFDALRAVLRDREFTRGEPIPEFKRKLSGQDADLAQHKPILITSQQLAQRTGEALPKFTVAIYGVRSVSMGAAIMQTPKLGLLLIMFAPVWDIVHNEMQRGAFVHEFRHVWDAAKYGFDAVFGNHPGGSGDADDAYANHQSEVDAHFTQLVQPIYAFLKAIKRPDVDFATVVGARSRYLGVDLKSFFRTQMKRSFIGVLGHDRAALAFWFRSLNATNKRDVMLRLAAMYRFAVRKADELMAQGR